MRELTDSPDWITRYECLRHGWLEQQRGDEDALFFRSGMIAWLKYGAPASSKEYRCRCVTNELDVSESAPLTIHGDLQRRLTRELTNLILHRQQEVPA